MQLFLKLKLFQLTFMLLFHKRIPDGGGDGWYSFGLCMVYLVGFGGRWSGRRGKVTET